MQAACAGTFPAVREAVRRQSSVGHFMLILIAVYLLFPYINDRLTGEPRIFAELSTSVSETHGIIVTDTIQVKQANKGTRNNLLLASDGTIMCLKTWPNIWMVNKSRDYALEAFVDCDKPVTMPFRVCSVFIVNSKGGIYRRFGDDYSFCSPLVSPIMNG